MSYITTGTPSRSLDIIASLTDFFGRLQMMREQEAAATMRQAAATKASTIGNLGQAFGSTFSQGVGIGAQEHLQRERWTQAGNAWAQQQGYPSMQAYLSATPQQRGAQFGQTEAAALDATRPARLADEQQRARQQAELQMELAPRAAETQRFVQSGFGDVGRFREFEQLQAQEAQLEREALEMEDDVRGRMDGRARRLLDDVNEQIGSLLDPRLNMQTPDNVRWHQLQNVRKMKADLIRRYATRPTQQTFPEKVAQRHVVLPNGGMFYEPQEGRLDYVAPDKSASGSGGKMWENGAPKPPQLDFSTPQSAAASVQLMEVYGNQLREWTKNVGAALIDEVNGRQFNPQTLQWEELPGVESKTDDNKADREFGADLTKTRQELYIQRQQQWTAQGMPQGQEPQYPTEEEAVESLARRPELRSSLEERKQMNAARQEIERSPLLRSLLAAKPDVRGKTIETNLRAAINRNLNKTLDEWDVKDRALFEVLTELQQGAYQPTER